MIEEGLYSRMTMYAPLVARIGTRVYPMVVPQSKPHEVLHPCVVYQLIGRERQQRYCGTDRVVRSLYQVDTYAVSYLAAKEVAELVVACLIDFRGTMGDVFVHHISLETEFDLDDPEPGFYRVSKTFGIWHGPPVPTP